MDYKNEDKMILYTGLQARLLWGRKKWQCVVTAVMCTSSAAENSSGLETYQCNVSLELVPEHRHQITVTQHADTLTSEI